MEPIIRTQASLVNASLKRLDLLQTKILETAVENERDFQLRYKLLKYYYIELSPHIKDDTIKNNINNKFITLAGEMKNFNRGSKNSHFTAQYEDLWMQLHRLVNKLINNR